MPRSWSSLVEQSKRLRGGYYMMDVVSDHSSSIMIDTRKSISTPNLRGLDTLDFERSEATKTDEKTNNDFKSRFKAEEMRSVALIAHNHMKPAMKKFVMEHKAVLSKFRLTGTGTTMKMLEEVFGKDHMVSYQCSLLLRSSTETSTPQSYSCTIL
jgi:hypothetical protein